MTRFSSQPIDLVVGARFTLPFKDVMKWLVTEESRTLLQPKMARQVSSSDKKIHSFKMKDKRF